MPVDTRLVNWATGYVEVVERLKRLVGDVRGLRVQADLMGWSIPAVLAEHPFPLPGDLTHIRSADQLLALLAGFEALFDAMGQPVGYVGADGEPRSIPVGAAIIAVGR
jgi:hypothetical protein